MPLKLTLRINLAWACVMALASLALIVPGASVSQWLAFVLLLVYVGVSFAALRRRSWALLISIGVAVVLLIRWLPMVLINFGMYFQDDRLYVDSPATIFIVAIYALLFALPALILCVLYAVQWRKVTSLVRHGVGYR
jgi:hypothetical protein